MSAIKDWILKRGILYALSQAPIFAILMGFFFKISTFPYMNCAVMLAFVVMPIWIVYRKNVSTDPDEPVHHLNRYALYAILPYIIFSVSRIPFMIFYNFPYWHPWYDFGHALTGEPINEFSSLLPGALLYSLQGYSLGLGFYILFRKHSLINSLLYLFVFLSSLYCYVFPEYARVGMPTSVLWHFVGWWAHFWMAIVAWYVPIFFETLSRFSSLARNFVIAMLACTVALPYAFAFYEAQTWQFPRQHALDQELFSRQDLVTLQSPVKLTALNENAEYEFILRVGPRSYKNYINKVRDIDIKNIHIFGEISYNNSILAWCSTRVEEVESPNLHDQFAPVYLAEIKKMEYTDIKVKCLGSADIKSKITEQSKLDLKWQATMTLIGDREAKERQYQGRAEGQMLAGLHEQTN